LNPSARGRDQDLLTCVPAAPPAEGAAVAWADIEALLNLAEEGREALQTKNSYGVMVSVAQSKMPAFYDKGVCTLSNALKPATLASYFVHEMVHALNDKGGWTSDPLTLDQDEYVLEMVSEELTATTRQYQFFVTLDVSGKLAALSPADKPPRYDEYRSAYKVGVQRASGTTTDQAKLHFAGIINANRLLAIYVRDRGLGVGIFSYGEFYGRQWQKARSAGGMSATP
jgi:hypothetical protein